MRQILLIIGLFFILIWTILWSLDLNFPFIRSLAHLYQVLHYPLYYQHKIHCIYDKDDRDYYDILMACDRIVPPGQQITLVLPRQPEEKFLFFREKGRYFLYPRNYGDNEHLATYLLVYDIKNYSMPAGYHAAYQFSRDKFLITNTPLIKDSKN